MIDRYHPARKNRYTNDTSFLSVAAKKSTSLGGRKGTSGAVTLWAFLLILRLRNRACFDR
jgi:hypothetical protein